MEGNTGTVETTLLQKLGHSLSTADKTKIKTDYEPVGAFQTFFGDDMINPLKNFYQNPKENAFVFQTYVLDINQQRMEVLSAMKPMCKISDGQRFGLFVNFSPAWTNITSMTYSSYT